MLSRLAVLRALEGMDVELAFDGYVDLVAYITKIHTTAPALAITTHLVGMASSVWYSLVKVLSECVSLRPFDSRNADIPTAHLQSPRSARRSTRMADTSRSAPRLDFTAHDRIQKRFR